MRRVQSVFWARMVRWGVGRRKACPCGGVWGENQHRGLVGAGLVDQAGEGGAEGEVFDVAEGVDAELAGAVDDDEAGGAAQAVAAHCYGGGDAWCVGINADGEGYLVFVKECFERDGGHGLVVFEDGVKSEERYIVAEILLNPSGLRDAVGDAAGAEHLKRFDYDDLAAEVGESWVGLGVEPAGDGQFGGGYVGGFGGHGIAQPSLRSS